MAAPARPPRRRGPVACRGHSDRARAEAARAEVAARAAGALRRDRRPDGLRRDERRPLTHRRARALGPGVQGPRRARSVPRQVRRCRRAGGRPRPRAGAPALVLVDLALGGRTDRPPCDRRATRATGAGLALRAVIRDFRPDDTPAAAALYPEYEWMTGARLLHK